MAIKAVAVVKGINVTGQPNDTRILLTVSLVTDVNPAQDISFGPYAQNERVSTRRADLDRDIKAFCTNTFGTVFGSDDVVQLFGVPDDL
jgi:hypothetical protein